MDEIVKEFLVESHENLDRLDQDLVELEKNPNQEDRIASIFRTMHTLKGASGFLGFTKLEAVAHIAENLLSKMRDGQLVMNPEIADGLLATVDAVRWMLGQIEGTGSPGEKEFPELLAELTRLNGDSAERANGSRRASVEMAGLELEAPPVARPTMAPQTAVAKPADLKGPAQAPNADSETAFLEAAETRSGAVSDSTIRVDVGLLDKLMNLVGELVLARNQILQYTAAGADSSFLATSQRLNLITTELQGSVMKTRMQPIGNVWNKLPRVVRDLASTCGKEVRIEMEGQETELDKTIIEAIKDPLTHIVRNAVDHGIETPDARAGRGKPTEGCLKMRAFHEGGQVNIEITDDGEGIDPERIRQKALQRGLITPEQSSRLSEREIVHLIFLPGFSTAEKITNVSGRGVGMDVVKTNIEKIGGTVDLQSRPGEGTTLKIKIPLTLAIIPALIITSGGDRFAIPQVNLLELVRLEGEQLRSQIEYIHGAPVHRLRGQLLPLAYLAKVLAGGNGFDAIDAQGASPAKSDATAVLDSAKARHQAWMERLDRFLSGEISMTLEQAGSHELCDLGKWLCSEGLQEFGDLFEILDLEQEHRVFHGFARQVVALKLSGRVPEAESVLAEALASSKRIIELLKEAERRVLENRSVNIVVLRADGNPFGLVVDAINDTEEIVVKPLGKQLKSVNLFAGATIMGDGRVALILDVMGLAQRARVVSEARGRNLSEASSQARKIMDTRQTLLLFEAGQGSRMAIPLSMVARLEEFRRGDIEYSGPREVVRYRGQILPLIDVARLFPPVGAARPETSDPMQVIVYSENGRSIGLVVGRINDIVHESIAVKRHSCGDGIFGSAVIQDRVTDLLDVQSMVKNADPSFYKGSPSSRNGV